MTSCFRVLTVSSLDSSPSMIFVAPNGRQTLINCGEGCQRTFLETMGARVRAVDRVCLTGLGHAEVGGLPGLILTSADAAAAGDGTDRESRRRGGGRGNDRSPGKRQQPSSTSTSTPTAGLEIVGPTGTSAFLRSLRFFMRRDNFRLDAREGTAGSSSSSNGDTKKGKKRKRGGNPRDPSADADFDVRAVPVPRRPPRRRDRETSPSSPPLCPEVVSFVLSTPPTPGRFLVDRAAAIGVPGGPVRARLKNGETVTCVSKLDGREITVRSEEVVAPPNNGAAVAVLRSPDHHVWDRLRREDAIRAWTNDDDDDKAADKPKPPPNTDLDCVVHMVPTSLYRTNDYRRWIDTFPETTHHVLLPTPNSIFEDGEDAFSRNPRTPFRSAFAGAVSRHLLSPDIYAAPCLIDEGDAKEDEDEEELDLSTDFLFETKQPSPPSPSETAKDVAHLGNDSAAATKPLLEKTNGDAKNTSPSDNLESTEAKSAPVVPIEEEKKEDREAVLSNEQTHSDDPNPTNDSSANGEHTTNNNDDNGDPFREEEDRLRTLRWNGEGEGADDEDDDDDNDDDSSKKRRFPRTVLAAPLMEFALVPRSKKGLRVENVRRDWRRRALTNTERERTVEVLRASGAAAAAEETASRATTAAAAAASSDGDRPTMGELTFTGTGSALPCKHRNVTGNYLRMTNGNAMLLDVGEGTTGQLLRAWTASAERENDEKSSSHRDDLVRDRLASVKAVWISHPHADHHVGVVRFLSERAAACGDVPPVVLIAPVCVFRFLEEYATVEPVLRRAYRPLDCRRLPASPQGRPNVAPALWRELRDDLGVEAMLAVPVAHCRDAHALVLRGRLCPFGRQLVYSGDCRPSDRLVAAATGRTDRRRRDGGPTTAAATAVTTTTTDLLLHEATFEDGMEEEAVLKRHSTVSEAVGVGRRMGARTIVLTHFSQRYPKIPEWRGGAPAANRATEEDEPPAEGAADDDGDAAGGPSTKTNTQDDRETRSKVAGSSERPSGKDTNVIFAFDFMTLRPHTVRLATMMTPALRLLYAEKEEETNKTNESNDDGRETRSGSASAKEILSEPGLFADSSLL